MACNDVVSAILHYKRNIDKIADPPERALKYEDRLLHCINKLYKLPVNVNHLQETGVGRTVNSLRKIEGEKGLGDAAKALVAKWKTMVMLEDEAERKQREEPEGPSEEDINRIKLIREAEKSDIKKTDNNYKSLHSSESHKSKNHDDSKRHRDGSDESKSKKRKHESEGSEKNHSKHRKTGSEGNDTERDRGGGGNIYEIKLKNRPSSSKDNDTSNHISPSSHKSHGSSRDERRREKEKDRDHKSSGREHSKSSHRNHENQDGSSSSSKEKSKKKNYAENDGFDSQSGASFADALGPILLKKSSKKKTCVSPAVPSPADRVSDNNEKETKREKEKKTDSSKNDVNETLFPQSKLEPLELDLVATLPTPTPYYKPHPSYVPSLEAVRRRVQAEEDALTTIMSNKNTRTKVYSGVKGGLSYVPTLYECCCRVLQQHIDALEYTGGIPFSLLKPVLEGATPSQLYQFEHFNPYIIEDTDDLWKFHVNKEFRNEKRQEFESWRDMYLRCIDEREEKYKAVTANIMQRTIENSIPVRKAKLAYIDVAKPPRNILKKQIKNGTAKPDSAKLLGKNDPEAVKVSAPKQPTTREPTIFKTKPKVAPLMQKTLKSIRMSRFKR